MPELVATCAICEKPLEEGQPVQMGLDGEGVHIACSDADYEEDEKPLRTKTGRVLTDADIQALADEAERGYDVEHLKGKPSIHLEARERRRQEER